MLKTVYLKCKEDYPEGYLTAIEHVLYRQGVTKFEYLISLKHVKVDFDDQIVSLEQILKKLEEIGYDAEVVDLDI